MAKNYQEKARELGYEVDLVLENADGEEHYRVQGQGMDTVYGASQEDAWIFLTTPEAHQHRVNMWKHNDPNDQFEMTDDEIFESSVNASLAAGLLDKAEAEEMRKYRKEAVAAQ